MTDEIELAFKGKMYRRSGDSWVDPSTNMTPPMQLIPRLNRLYLDEYSESLFNSWGKEDLPRFHQFLKSNGGKRSDYERFGMSFLLDLPDNPDWPGESPLHLLGYRVGSNGLAESSRRELLHKAYSEQLPNIGTAEYMAAWGLPGTRSRLRALIKHIRMVIVTGGPKEGDCSEAIQAWTSDVIWLSQLLEEANTEGLRTQI